MSGNVGVLDVAPGTEQSKFPNVVRTIEIEAFRFASLKQRIGIRLQFCVAYQSVSHSACQLKVF
jgi:hypothetical protein